MTSYRAKADDRTESRCLQRTLDEIAILEPELEHVWPDSQRIRAELEAGERELSALRAEARELEGARRFADFALAGAWAAPVAFWIMIACILAGGR